MIQLDASNILSYGVIGLGFLLAFLAYRLLGREQERTEPRRSILVAVYVFMIFSVVLCVIGFVSEYFRHAPTTDTTAELKELQQIAQVQANLIQKYQQREKDYIANFDASMKSINAAITFLPNAVSKPVLEATEKIKPHTVEISKEERALLDKFESRKVE